MGIDCTQFGQQPKSIANHLGIWRIHEGKFAHIAKTQLQHAKNDRCKMGPQYLCVSKLGSSQEVLLRVETKTHPLGDTPTTALSLICTGLGNRLDRESL